MQTTTNVPPACRGMGFVILLAVAALAQNAPDPAVDAHVPSIRFGYIEPPVIAQQDITVLAPPSNIDTQLKPLECSGLAWTGGQLLISSDRHGHVIFTCQVDLQRPAIGRPKPLLIIANEQQLLDDAEALTLVHHERGAALHILCSLSNDLNELPLPKRRHMARLEYEGDAAVTPRRTVVLDAGPVRNILSRHLRAAGVEPYRTYNHEFAGRNKNTYRWGNVEGMAVIPDGDPPGRLLCGMRNPLLNDEAILFVLGGVDRAFDRGRMQAVEVQDLFTLPLSGRGISDLTWDPLTRGYLIAAARSAGLKLDKDQPFPPNTLDSALFWWSGRKDERPRMFATVPDMNVEAICRLGDSPYLAIGSDEGDVSEGRSERQSVLTILVFTGVGQ